MIYLKARTNQIITAIVLTLILAGMSFLSCVMVYADDQSVDMQQPQTEAAAPAETPAPVASPSAPDAAETAAPVQAEGSAAAEGQSAPDVDEETAPAEGIEEEAVPAEDAGEEVSEETGDLTVSDAKAADTDVNAENGDTKDPAADFDITAQTITNLLFDESTGIVSWDPIIVPEDSGLTIKYYLYLMGKNIENEELSIFDGTKGLILTTNKTSINVDQDADFQKTFLDFQGADYTFYVKGTDMSKDKNEYRFSRVTTSSVYKLSHRKLEVYIYTRTHSYNKRTNEFTDDVRRHAQSQGGEILMDGVSLNRVIGGGGGYVLAFYDMRPIKTGTTVELSYVPAQGYRFYSERIDGGTNNTNASTTRSLLMDQSHIITVYFEQPIAEIIAKGIEATSDNFNDVAPAILANDASAAGAKSDTEGYLQMYVDTVRESSLSAADRDICDNDSTLKSKNIKSGLFFNVTFTESLNQELPVDIAKTSKSVNIRLIIPDSLKSTANNIRRTFYLIRVDNGEANVIADGSYEELNGYITESGLYLIGYKDTNLEGILSGNTSNNYSYAYAVVEPEPVAEPAPVEVSIEAAEVPAAAGVMQDEVAFPVSAAAVAAGTTAAVVCGGGIALRKILSSILKKKAAA